MNLKKATTILLFSTFALLLIGLSGCNYSKEYLEQINYNSFKNKVENKESFVLYVSNKSCSHCQNFEPKLREVINKEQITIYKIDTATLSTDEYDEFLEPIGSIGTPTVLFFYDGIESGTTNRIDGDVDEDKIIEKLKTNKYIKD